MLPFISSLAFSSRFLLRGNICCFLVCPVVLLLVAILLDEFGDRIGVVDIDILDDVMRVEGDIDA